MLEQQGKMLVTEKETRKLAKLGVFLFQIIFRFGKAVDYQMDFGVYFLNTFGYSFSIRCNQLLQDW